MRSGNECTIRDAVAEDSHAILECLAQAFAPFRDQYTHGAFLDTALTVESLRKRFAEMRILVAQNDSERMIGTIAYRIVGLEGHIRGMAVLPANQGQGIAGALLVRAEVDLRAAGCRRVTLETTRPLARAIRFYERNGYLQTGAIASFFGMELLGYRKEL